MKNRMNLQNNFTTPEQSKRLLELGVPADSADCLLDNEWLEIDEDDVPSVIHKTHKFTDYDQQNYTPCWSVGRLIEIMKICNHPDDVDEVFCELAYSKKNIVELIVRLMEENKEITEFSKLEE